VPYQQETKKQKFIREINQTLAKLAERLYPDIAVIDGFYGMQGNGPVDGDPVNSQLAIASTDFLAADAVGAAVMGIDVQNIGYLCLASKAGLGEIDFRNIKILGNSIRDCMKPYRSHDTIEEQLKWR